MLTDNRTHEIIVPKCPLCGGKWVFYDGILGYESLVCEKCRFDYQQIKIVVKRKEG